MPVTFSQTAHQREKKAEVFKEWVGGLSLRSKALTTVLSGSIRKIGDRRWTVVGNLTLHGETRSITVNVHSDVGAYLGESKIRQTQFGIYPVSGAGGAVKVKDELTIDFRMLANK